MVSHGKILQNIRYVAIIAKLGKWDILEKPSRRLSGVDFRSIGHRNYMLKILEVQLSSFAVFIVLPSRCFRHDHFEETTEMCLSSHYYFSEHRCHTMLILWCSHLNWVFQTMCFPTHHSATRSVTFVFLLLRSDLWSLSPDLLHFSGDDLCGLKTAERGSYSKARLPNKGPHPLPLIATFFPYEGLWT